MKHLFLTLFILTTTSISFAQNDLSDSTDAEKTVDTAEVTMSTFLVFFPTASFAIDKRYHPDLDRIVQQLKESNETIELLGYTDDIGGAADNQKLSEQRANAVQAYLLQSGISADRMQVAFFGEDRPQADNATETGRSQNRRVEIRLSSAMSPSTELTVKGDTTLYVAEKADSLQQLLIMPERAKLVEKPMPVMREPSVVKLQAVQRQVISSNGATLKLQYRYQSGSVRPQRVFLQVAGAKSFYDVPVTVTATAGQLEVPVAFPTLLGKGEIAVVASLLNAKGRLSQTDTTFVTMERVGTGKLQITLAWDTDTDQDIYVKTPSGETISYMNKHADDDGELDRDDTDGYGPENVYWLAEAPDGEYVISVNDYLHTSQDNAFVITINGLGVNRQFYGTTRDGATVLVVTFEKQGDQIVWR